MAEVKQGGLIDNQSQPVVNISLPTPTKSVVEAKKDTPTVNLVLPKEKEVAVNIAVPKYSYVKFTQSKVGETNDYWEQYKYFYGVDDNVASLYQKNQAQTKMCH